MREVLFDRRRRRHRRRPNTSRVEHSSGPGLADAFHSRYRDGSRGSHVVLMVRIILYIYLQYQYNVRHFLLNCFHCSKALFISCIYSNFLSRTRSSSELARQRRDRRGEEIFTTLRDDPFDGQLQEGLLSARVRTDGLSAGRVAAVCTNCKAKFLFMKSLGERCRIICSLMGSNPMTKFFVGSSGLGFGGKFWLFTQASSSPMIQ